MSPLGLNEDWWNRLGKYKRWNRFYKSVLSQSRWNSLDLFTFLPIQLFTKHPDRALRNTKIINYHINKAKFRENIRTRHYLVIFCCCCWYMKYETILCLFGISSFCLSFSLGHISPKGQKEPKYYILRI